MIVEYIQLMILNECVVLEQILGLTRRLRHHMHQLYETLEELGDHRHLHHQLALSAFVDWKN